MTFSEIIRYILYGMSGFFFGIFASRYSILATVKLRGNLREKGFGNGLLCSVPQILFLALAFFIFPVLFITRTQVGGFFYYLVLIYFFNKGYRMYIQSK